MRNIHIRYPYNAGAWIAVLATVAVFAGFAGWFIGLPMGYRQGETQTRLSLEPDITANAEMISVLNDRLMNQQAAVTMETTASYYGESHRGKLTASGARFNPDELTAASPWLPFGSRWRVTRLDTDVSVLVTVTDRGPAPRLGRGIDLSLAAARVIGMIHDGVVRVRIEPSL